ncbi:MAG: heme o synthase [Chitinophagales bacterium]|tara:strand:- start:313 stop:1215 length:903 start_codon:yes stop_codon:yes gene_type:complete
MSRRGRGISISFKSTLAAKLSDVAQLYKVRLGSLVVFSSVIGYLLLAPTFDFLALLMLSIGGFLVTGASNAFNQIFEKDIDSLMDRTKNRPIPAGRMTAVEGSLWAGIAALVGLVILTIFFNLATGLLSAISLIIYAFIYTPLKRVHPIAVFVGAIPGALPPMIGAVAATGFVGDIAICLFALQFIWQFPHFWAIAWYSYDDYKKADIMLLPSKGGKNKNSALNILIYTATLIPITIILYLLGYYQFFGLVVLLLAAVVFLIPAIQLYRDISDINARKVMFASFMYLPVALIGLLIDSIL